MTTVVLPFVDGMLHQDLMRAVKLSGLPYVMWQLDPRDEGAYGRLVREWWAQPADMVIIEHDVVPSVLQILEVATCGHDWCGFNYDDGLYPDGPMFGCVRLSRRLMVRHPYAAEVALVEGKRKDQETPWWRVDSMMARDLMIRGERWLAHVGRVHHAHVGAPSGPA